MKTLKICLAFSAVFLLVISFGCSKDDPAAPPANDTNVATQQGYASTTLETTNDIVNFTAGLSGGLSNWDPATSTKRNTQKIDTIIWIGPTTHSNHYNPTANDGWYYNPVDTINHITVWAKYSPNRVIDPNAIVTRIDWEHYWDLDSARMEHSAFASEITGSDRLNAGWYFSLNNNPIAKSEIYWECELDSITKTGWGGELRSCSGNLELSYVYSTTSPDTLMHLNLSFDNGIGTGSLYYLDIEVVKYTFNNNGTGYYRVAADSFIQQYPFTW